MSTQAKIILSAEDRTRAAFDTATRELDRYTQTAAIAQKAVAGLAAGFSLAAASNYVKNLSSAALEVQRLSALVNTSTERFQAEAYAAQRAGVSQEKYADILKDVQDKVGDFLQTGGGPMKDFFDSIAPRVGVTAEQFRKLNGADALQLYVSSLQKANLSQSEMTFYMEAIASDSTLLLPLLRDNGKAMGEMADEARRLGVVMNDDAVKAARLLNDNLTRLESAGKGLAASIGNVIIPEVNRLSNEFLIGIKHADGFWDALRTLGGAGVFDSPAAGAKHYREELERLRKSRDELIEREGVMANTSGFDRDIDRAGKRAAYFNDLMRSDWRLSGERMGVNDPRVIGASPTEETAGYRPPKTPKTTPSTKPDKSAQEYDAWMKSMTDAEDRYRQSSFLKRLDAEQQAQKEHQDWLKSMDDAAGQYVYARHVERLEKEEKLKKEAIEKVVRAQEEQAQKLGDAFASTFDRAFTDGMKLGDLLKKLAYDAINIQFLTPATQKIGSSLGSAISSLFSFDGGGYTGSGARSGGLDGKGGFMAVLHPNETVVDHSRGQGTGSAGGTTIVQNISIDARGADASVDQKIRAAMSQTKAETLAAVQAKANRGGSFAASMGRA